MMRELQEFFTNVPLDETEAEPLIVKLPKVMKVTTPAPDFFHQIAARDDANDWITAMKKETTSLMNLKTFNVVDLVPRNYNGHHPIPVHLHR